MIALMRTINPVNKEVTFFWGVFKRILGDDLPRCLKVGYSKFYSILLGGF